MFGDVSGSMTLLYIAILSAGSDCSVIHTVRFRNQVIFLIPLFSPLPYRQPTRLRESPPQYPDRPTAHHSEQVHLPKGRDPVWETTGEIEQLTSRSHPPCISRERQELQNTLTVRLQLSDECDKLDAALWTYKLSDKDC